MQQFEQNLHSYQFQNHAQIQQKIQQLANQRNRKNTAIISTASTKNAAIRSTASTKKKKQQLILKCNLNCNCNGFNFFVVFVEQNGIQFKCS